MDTEYESLKESAHLRDIVLNTSDSRYPHFLVINDKDELVGMLSMGDLKNCLPEIEELNELIVAADIMTKNIYCITQDDNLATAFEIFEGKQISTLPVVDVKNSKKVVGALKKNDLILAYNQKILKTGMSRLNKYTLL